MTSACWFKNAFRAVPPENRPVPQKVYRRPVMRRQEPAERSRYICGTSLESSMLLAPGHDGCTRIHFNGPAGVNEDDVRELLSITNEKNHNNTYRCDDS